MQDGAGLFFYTYIMNDFSKQLIDDAKDYFSSLYGRAVSDDEAESFLKSLIRLFDSLS